MSYSSAREEEFLFEVQKQQALAKELQDFLQRAAPPSKLAAFNPALSEIRAHLSNLSDHCIKNLRG
jgi:hypothetical protein